MLVTNEKLNALRTGYSARFNKRFGEVSSQAMLLATEVPSTTSSNTYGWLGLIPKLREWIGERRFQNLKEFSYEIKNRKFDAGVEIDLDDFDDDNIGHYSAIVDGWGDSAAKWAPDLVVEALKKGHQAVCYDGQNFFDTDHVVEYKGADGVKVTETVANVYAGASSPWYLADLSQPLKPIIFQPRKKPEFWMQTNVKSEYVEMNQKVPMTATARGNAGYGMWQVAAKSQATLNEANYEIVKLAMAQIKDENGDKLGIYPTHIFVGPSNEAAADKLFNVQYLAGGGNNPLYNKVKVIVLRELD